MPKNLNSRIQRIAEENPAQALLGHSWLFSFLPRGGMKSPCRRSAARSLGGAQRQAHLCSARGGARAPRAAAKQPQAASAWRPRAGTRRSSSDASEERRCGRRARAPGSARALHSLPRRQGAATSAQPGAQLSLLRTSRALAALGPPRCHSAHALRPWRQERGDLEGEPGPDAGARASVA